MRISYEWEVPKKFTETNPIAIVNIYPTMKCNYNCEYCFTKETLNKNYKKENQVIEKLKDLYIFLKKFSNVGLKKIKFHILGGEPSFAPLKFYLEFLKYLKKLNNKNNFIFEIYFFTNASDLNKIKKIYNIFKNFKFIIFDLLYSYHSTQITFEKYIKNSKELLKIIPAENLNLLTFNLHFSKNKLRKKFKEIKKYNFLLMINSINYHIFYKNFSQK